MTNMAEEIRNFVPTHRGLNANSSFYYAIQARAFEKIIRNKRIVHVPVDKYNTGQSHQSQRDATNFP